MRDVQRKRDFVQKVGEKSLPEILCWKVKNMIGEIQIPKNKVELVREIQRSNIKRVLVLNNLVKDEVSKQKKSIEDFIGRSVGTIIVVKEDA